MKQEIKTPHPHRKKLFEWDKNRRILSVVRNRRQFMYELADDNTFHCIKISDRPPDKKQ